MLLNPFNVRFTRSLLSRRLVILLVQVLGVLFLLLLCFSAGVRHNVLNIFGHKWKRYEKLDFSCGLNSLVAVQQNHPSPLDRSNAGSLIKYEPYSPDRLNVVKRCFLADRVPPPTMYAYEGTPSNHPGPRTGSHGLLGFREDICFERLGRLVPYGLKYESELASTTLRTPEDDAATFQALADSALQWVGQDLGDIQRRCHERNEHRFTQMFGQLPTSRSVVVLRSWIGFEYTQHTMLNIRALINELNLGSGAEYDIHLLVHVKDNTLAFWDSETLAQAILDENVPHELHDMTTLWSEEQLKTFYPGPFQKSRKNPSGKSIRGVWRSSHWALQYFAAKHQEYDFFWNWEMDIRYTGHYYELFDKLGRWSKDQPRKGIWERNAKFYIEGLHGDWSSFSKIVQEENILNNVVWGPVPLANSTSLKPQLPPPPPEDEENKSWGVGEEADLITLSPQFDPVNTGWYNENDVTGYDLSVPAPPRRSSIVAVSRLSKKLLGVMHNETLQLKHSMWTEMFAPSCALHYGLKSVYAPHPVYSERDWPAVAVEKALNGGKFGSSGGSRSTSFVHEHNHKGSTWYCNARFAGTLWRRWLGYAEGGEGGLRREVSGRGRVCLKSMLFHPVRYDDP